MNPLRPPSSRSRQRMVGQGRSALAPSLPEQVRPTPPPSRPELFRTPSRPSRRGLFRTPSPPSRPELVRTPPPPSLPDLLRSPPPPFPQQHLQYLEVFKLLVFLRGGDVLLRQAPVKGCTHQVDLPVCSSQTTVQKIPI